MSLLRSCESITRSSLRRTKWCAHRDAYLSNSNSARSCQHRPSSFSTWSYSNDNTVKSIFHATLINYSAKPEDVTLGQRTALTRVYSKLYNLFSNIKYFKFVKYRCQKQSSFRSSSPFYKTIYCMCMHGSRSSNI